MIDDIGALLSSLDLTTLCIAALIILAAAVAVGEIFHPARKQSPVQGRRLFANFSLSLLNILLTMILPVSSVFIAEKCAASGFGLMNMLALPQPLHIAATLIFASLTGYAAHVAMHRIPLFWRFHAIHHSDQEMDFSTSLRHHPGDIICLLLMQIPLLALFGAHPGTLLFLSVIEWFTHVLAHGNIGINARVNKWLGNCVLTPTMHAVHHSSLQKETDSNFGSVFSGWDRLFATYKPDFSAPPEKIRLGLDEFPPAKSASLLALLAHPFAPGKTSEMIAVPSAGPGGKTPA